MISNRCFHRLIQFPIVILLPLLLLSVAQSGDTVKPQLIIESGGHQDRVTGLAFTKDGRFLVSGSIDKTIRIWDVEKGELINVIRGQIGKGLEGSIYSISLSADDQTLMSSGMFTECT